MSEASVRQFQAEARSTGVFGRVLLSSRNHHFVVDGPVENGCPGEAITPAELFLSGVAACGVELLQVIARERGLTPPAIEVRITGAIDRARPVRSDLMVFNAVRMSFDLKGVTPEQGAELIEAFKGR